MKERKSEKEREIDTSATKGKCRERMGEGGGVEGGREGGRGNEKDAREGEERETERSCKGGGVR